MKLIILAALGVAFAPVTWALEGMTRPAMPLGSHMTSPTDPYQMFVDHFSAQKAGTDTYLLDRFRHLYPNSSITISQDYQFNLFAYAAGHPEKVIIQEIEDVQTIKHEVFLPALRRRDGGGVLAENVLFGGYRVAYGDEEMVVYTAAWPEGFGMTRQWHIISDQEDVARRLIYAVSVFSTTFSEAVLVFDQGYWRPDHALWEAVQKASWEEVILNEEFKHRLQGDYRSFFKSEKIYKDLSVPWKRGLILLGPPGNGKTVSIKAIMKDVKVPALYVKSLHSYMGDEFAIRSMFERARREAPCVLIMEDLDSLINDANRSFFLNEVDGLEDNDGLLMIATTNHFDRLDPALSNRPSRFDRKYSFDDPTESERRQYAVWWQNKLKSNAKLDFPDSLLDKVAHETNHFSFAYLKEAFVSALLTLAEDDDESKRGSQFPTVLMEQIKFLKDQLDQADYGSSMAASWSDYLVTGSNDMIEPGFPGQIDYPMQDSVPSMTMPVPMGVDQMAIPTAENQVVFSPVGLRREVMA